MRHDWIFDVLSDLVAYAEKNDLPKLAEKALDALRQAELDLDRRKEADLTSEALYPQPRGRPH